MCVCETALVVIGVEGAVWGAGGLICVRGGRRGFEAVIQGY